MRLALRLPLAKLPPPRRWRWRLSDRTGSPSGGQAALGRLAAFSVAPLATGDEIGRIEPRSAFGQGHNMIDRVCRPTAPATPPTAGSYRCTNCGNEIQVQSVQSLPPCPSCGGPNEWEPMSGGDSAQDPYPNN
jgi:hypothetical protein